MQKSFILNQEQNRSGLSYNILGMRVYLKISGDDTAGQLSAFTANYHKGQGPPLHSHDVDETFYITSGEFSFQTGDLRIVASVGDIVFIPRNMPHAFLTLSESAGMFFTVNPTGNVEKIFDKLNSFTEFPSVEEIVRVHEELGMKILGPPLS